MKEARGTEYHKQIVCNDAVCFLTESVFPAMLTVKTEKSFTGTINFQPLPSSVKFLERDSSAVTLQTYQ